MKAKTLAALTAEQNDPRLKITEVIYCRNKTSHGIEQILILAAETYLNRNTDLIWTGHKIFSEDEYMKREYHLLFTYKTKEDEKS